MLGFTKGKKFDFCKYITRTAGYVLKEDYHNIGIFQNGHLQITVYNIKSVKGYDLVTIDFDSTNIVTMKFIPKSKTMTEIMLHQITREINAPSENVPATQEA